MLHFICSFSKLIWTIARLMCCKGRRKRGVMTGINFPVSLKDLVGLQGPELLTQMLRHSGHLPTEVSIKSVRRADISLRDGVKGEKSILEVTYDGPSKLPTKFFVKFNLQKLSAMRLLIETTEVCRCEAFFYHYMSSQTSPLLRSPTCYFVDYSDVTGEFVLVSDVVEFGVDDVLPLKHRIRDAPTLEEQRLFITVGATLNAKLCLAKLSPLVEQIPRFDQTHQQFWVLAQLSAKKGLHHTTRKTLRGKKVNTAFMTWDPPAGLLGRESELIADMPSILTSLCQDEAMLAFGHNDFVIDNVYFRRDAHGSLTCGAFDWQQSCLNNVGQEWAWNLHFLPPEFLDAHEAELIDLYLETCAREGLLVTKESFLNAYVLGTVQMYVFGGGGLQLLLGDLHSRGVFEKLVPEDVRCCDESLDEELRERIVGAEMTRRTFTNCCNIMRRHDFCTAWQKWKNAHKVPNGASNHRSHVA